MDYSIERSEGFSALNPAAAGFHRVVMPENSDFTVILQSLLEQAFCDIFLL